MIIYLSRIIILIIFITMIELKPHQKIPVEFMKTHKSLLLYHSTGSGKTLTSLFAMCQFEPDIIIIGPKSSKKAFLDNIQEAEFDIERFTFYSYTKVKNILLDDPMLFKDKSIIVDEAHHLRTQTIHNLYIISALVYSFKFILLTATPIVNYLNDLSVLINLVKESDDLPTEMALFNQFYLDESETNIVNEHILHDKLRNAISYYSNKDNREYPASTVHYMNVEMNYEQFVEYLAYLRKIIFENKIELDQYNLPKVNFDLLDKKKKNFFLSATRQLSNTWRKNQPSPKITEIFTTVKSGPKPAIVYSNFLKNGIYTLASLLELNNVKYGVISGAVTADKLNVVVNNYNNSMYDVLLISSAGSESLDLKNTRQIHIMEPYWNESKIMQILGRAIRYHSHQSLPPDQRHVDIYRWISVFPSQINPNAFLQTPVVEEKFSKISASNVITADQYIARLSHNKEVLADKFTSIIIGASIEKDTEWKKSNAHHKYKKYKHKYTRLRKSLKK